jgi:hypothetical protein
LSTTKKSITAPQVGCFALAIFLGAFLLFQVQPLISKAILPWYGGTPNVWTTCMLFFQSLLFAGYAYAHYSTRWLAPRSQGILHIALVAVALLMPILPATDWKPDGVVQPTLSIFWLLSAHVGLPFFVLASTSPLIQYWWNRASPHGSPYRLYALSNVGSLLALLSYPFLVEPLLPLGSQAVFWFGAFLVFAALVIVCGSTAWWPRGAQPSDSRPVESTAHETVTGIQRLLWVALAAVGSVMLLATTNHISHDIAVVPLLWVAPLSLYLLTFILCFAGCYPRWTSITVMLILTAYIALDQVGGVVWVAKQVGAEVTSVSGVPENYLAALLTYLLAMTVCCMVCHGEMVRLQPPPGGLTSYYLHIGFGGALGGVAVAIGGPLLLTGHYELQIGMILCWLLLLVVLYHDPRSAWYAGRSLWAWSATSAIYCVFAFGLFFYMLKPTPGRVAVSRSFYGVLAVNEEHADDEDLHHFELVNGLILHGKQYTRQDKRRWPTTYYGPESGVGLAMAFTADRPQRRVGVIGLGTGSVAVYGTGDNYFRFYEIDENVVTFARKYFTYLADLEQIASRPDIVMGDARVSLERELQRGQAQDFDLIVLDAFSSDAIPAHLLTREAFAIYLQHLRDAHERQGLLAVHISNRYLDLLPVLQSVARYHDLTIAQVKSEKDDDAHVYKADWVLFSRPGGLDSLLEDESSVVPVPGAGGEPVWTDDYTNILSVLE